MRKFTALLAAAMLALVTLTPAEADAQRRGHGYYDGRGHHGYYDRRHHRRHHRDNGDAVAAGVVGLVLGLAIGSLANQPRRPDAHCTNNYQRCAPPPRQGYSQGYYRDEYRGQPYYGEGGYEQGYDGQSAYERDYGYAPDDQLYGGPPPQQQSQCTRRERQWDRYANRYLMVDVPC